MTALVSLLQLELMELRKQQDMEVFLTQEQGFDSR